MTEQRTPQQAAADWYLSLREDPDGEDLKVRFEQWLIEDDAHAEAWARMNATATRINSAAALYRSAHVAERRAEPTSQRSRRHLRRFFLPVAAVAAMGAVVILNGSDLLLRLRADYVTPVGDTRDLRLADGSTVTLAPHSAIAVETNSEGRSVRLLRGEALFDVRHDAARPFRVMAADVEATDIGTLFDVRMEDNATMVAVRQGKVHVRDPGKADRDLQAGEWIRVSDDVVTGTMPPNAIGAWRDGALIANDQTIAQVMASLRPWSKARIVLTSQALGEKRVTGTYDLHKPEASLRLIVGPYGGTVKSVTSWFDFVSGR
ncbi:FecR family protein [Gluconacetobacter sacchari]|uniref:FecR family protein n=1 Tax=Gluconacetobacter sacchari TaxID=92759 RepID=UPI0039B5C147